MRTSSVAHPPNHYFLKIYRWQLEFCDDNECAAALLSFFEFRDNGRLNEPQDQRELWQHYTMRQLEAGVLIYKRDTIIEAMQDLEKKDAIKCNIAHRGDGFPKTYQILFRPETVNFWIEQHYPWSTDPRKNPGVPSEKSEVPSEKSEGSEGQTIESREDIIPKKLKERKREETTTTVVGPVSGSDAAGAPPQTPPSRESNPFPPKWSAFWMEYPRHRRLPRYEETAKREWIKLSPADQRQCCDRLAELKDNRKWREKGGQYVPGPAKFIEDMDGLYWRNQGPMGCRTEIEVIHKMWLSISGQPKTLNQLTEERAENIWTCWLKCVKGSQDNKPMELIKTAICACLDHWEENGKRKATLDDVFGSIPKFEQCLTWAGYR